eukprot:TRINITY_DN15592_c0_g1_i1.p2 TRINITY_DN15592_c0_g1~~TRINITY_DN15592_c0_g1_i1.p2  ORF type:complete len:132 (-),score=17.19 TRINITY_DN15592_c0_g1_i1:94-489(-)
MRTRSKNNSALLIHANYAQHAVLCRLSAPLCGQQARLRRTVVSALLHGKRYSKDASSAHPEEPEAHPSRCRLLRQNVGLRGSHCIRQHLGLIFEHRYFLVQGVHPDLGPASENSHSSDSELDELCAVVSLW